MSKIIITNKIKSFEAIKYVTDKLQLNEPKIVRYNPNKVSDALKSFYEVNRVVKSRIVNEKLKYRFKHLDYKKALLDLTKQLIKSDK